MTSPGVASRFDDVIVRRCLLGVHCLDAHTGKPVSNRLQLSLIADSGAGRALAPVRGPSGNYSFHSIAGMKAYEDVDLKIPPTPPRRFLLVVADELRRYLPIAVMVTLPRQEPLLDVLLFGTAKYEAPARWAVLRGRAADVWKIVGGVRDPASAPASWARIGIHIAGEPTDHVTICDARGEFQACFPFPRDYDAAAPPAMTIEARYFGASQRPVPGHPQPEFTSLMTQPKAKVVTAFPVAGPLVLVDALQLPLTQDDFIRVGSGANDALWVVPSP